MQEGGTAPKYSAWQAPIMAFFNMNFYGDVLTRWHGSGCLYMLVACVFAALFMVAPFAVPLCGAVANPDVSAFMQQIPKCSFSDGTVSIDKPVPYKITEARTGAVIAEFRTNDKGTPAVKPDDPPIVVTRDVLSITESKDSEPKVYQFAQLSTILPSFLFDGNDAMSLLHFVAIALPVGAVLFGVPMLWTVHLLQMLIYGGVAMIVFNCGKTPMPYTTGLRLAAVAMTPSIVVSSLINLAKTGIHLPDAAWTRIGFVWAAASFALTLIYIIAGILSNKPKLQSAEEPVPSWQ